MIIKLGDSYVNTYYITSVSDDPNFVYMSNGTVGRFIIYTLRNDEEIYVPYSVITFSKFLTEWKQST